MTDTIDITESRAIFNGGQFDTDFRYLRTTAAGVMTTMLAGPSIAVIFNQSFDQIAYRYKCGSYIVVANTNNQSAPADVANIASGIAL